MSNSNQPPTPAGNPPASPQTLDAQDKIARLRAIADEFVGDTDIRPLTKAERRLASATSVEFMEKAAIFSDAAPNVGVTLSANSAAMRDAAASKLAGGGVIDEARAGAKRMEAASLRNYYEAAKTARGVYRVAKGYVTTDSGNAVTPHVEEMKRALQKKRPKKAATPAEPPAPVPAAQEGADSPPKAK
jgi:hypothetical protein